jgi:hypothetical protein
MIVCHKFVTTFERALPNAIKPKFHDQGRWITAPGEGWPPSTLDVSDRWPAAAG